MIAIEYLAQIIIFIIEDVLITCTKDKIDATIVSQECNEWAQDQRNIFI